MELFNRIFGGKEESDYKQTLGQVYNPLIGEIGNIERKEVKEFFNVILDASERALRGILFMSPTEFNFKKYIMKENIDFWTRRVSLALISYSYYFYEINPVLMGLEENPYKDFWQEIFGTYNKLFNEKIGKKEIDKYAAGLKQDNKMGYSQFGDMRKAFECANRDYLTIASELLDNIWQEKIDLFALKTDVFEALKLYNPDQILKKVAPETRKALFLGIRIWQSHQQIVQPLVMRLLNEL